MHYIIVSAKVNNVIGVLIFINDIPAGIRSKIKIFANDGSVFSDMTDDIRTSKILNEDLHLLSKLTFKWKMSFNPDP